MIIKALFKRYKRWNPVHPTAGAFWGMGVGVGCGVGWGPGFGPEVIGYVGAGCGVGFSVGFTLAGVGVGLPANYIFRIPHHAFVTSTDAFISAKSITIPVLKYLSGDGSSYNAQQTSSLGNFASQNFTNFKSKFDKAKSVQWPKVQNILSSHVQSFGACIEECKRQHSAKKGS